MTATEALLQVMLDEFALRRLVHTYCRAVDRGDFATLRELYHDDAVDAHGAISTGTVDEFLKTLEASRPHIRSMQHNVTTVNFVVDGNLAEGEIYTIATHTFSGGDRDVDVIIGGRYLDKYEKRHDIWKIIERTIVTDWANVNDPSSVDLSHPITRGTLKGSPDADDPSHQFFSLFAAQAR
jgi:ketosteroid isomerase-like protein